MVQLRTTARPNSTNQEYQARHSDRATLLSIEEEIRNRAYEIYVARGMTPGREGDDWAQAEREIRERRRN